MDMKVISWFGNIYQKLEALCLEIEEAMYQDTVKYVEDQVQTVGSSVKRLYSDVMLDLHPQCNLDPVKVAAADLSLNPYAHTEIKKKLKAKLKGYPRGNSKDLIDNTQVIKGKSKSGGVYRRQNVGIKEIVRDSHPTSKKPDALCLVSGDATKFSPDSKVRGSFEVASERSSMTPPLASVKGRESVEAANEVYDHIMDINVAAAGISSNAAASGTNLSVESGGKDQEDNRNTVSVRDVKSDFHDSCKHKESAGENGSQITERSDKCCSTTPEKFDLIESDVEIVERFDGLELEETCVMVEGDGFHVLEGPVKQKSFKKKLREVFSTRKKSGTKEYEQLRALHGVQQPNLEVEDKVTMQVLATDSDNKNLSTNDHNSESDEWELL